MNKIVRTIALCVIYGAATCAGEKLWKEALGPQIDKAVIKLKERKISKTEC